MAGPVSTSTSLNGAVGPRPWLDATRQDALIRSSDLLRDRLLRTDSALSQVTTTFSKANVDTFTRGTTLAYASRELGANLRAVDTLQQQLGAAMADSPTYQQLASSSAGKAFFGTVHVTATTLAPTADSAAAIADLARTQSQAVRDFADMQKILADPNASSVLKIAATAKATQSASTFVQQQQRTLRALQAADASYLTNPTYQKLTAQMRDQRSLRFLSKLDGPVLSKAVGIAQVAGTIGGVVAGSITLPTMVRSIGKTYEHLKDTLSDSEATDNQRLDALADLSRATAGTIQNVNGLRIGVVSLGEMAAASRPFGAVMQRLELVQPLQVAGSWFTRIMKVLSPIADVGMLVADLVKLRTVFTDPQATIGGKFRAILNVGLDGLKLVTWLMPQTALLRLAYLGASVAQLGLAVYDFGGHLIPRMTKTGSQIVDAATHPPSALKELGRSLGAGLEIAAHGVYSAATTLAWGVAHPGQALHAIAAKASEAVGGAHEVGGVIKDSASLVQRSMRDPAAP